MPLKRTPPSSPSITVSAPTAHETPAASSVPTMFLSALQLPSALHHCSSEPSLTVPFRKRKRSEDDNLKMEMFMDEIKEMFSKFKEDQDRREERLYNSMEEIKTSMGFLTQHIDTLQTRVIKLEAERETDAQQRKILEEKIENLERYTRSTCLEIKNIPSMSTETKSSLLDIFVNVGKVLNVQVQSNDVKDIFRINTKDPANKTIIVDLSSVLLKEKIMSMYRSFNKGISKLSTEHLRISGPAKPIFISENLTAKMKRLFFLTRDFAKVNDYKYCWVSHGKIFIRKRENGPLRRITTENDLVNPQNNKQ